MNRSLFLALGALPAVAASLGACGSQFRHVSIAIPSPTAIAPAASATAAPTNVGPISVALTDPAPGLVPFTCTIPVVRSGSAEPPPGGLARPTTTRVAGHAGYDRMVFEYSGVALPALSITTVAPPFLRVGGGPPLTVSGHVFLGIVFRNLPFPSGYNGPSSFKNGLPVLSDLELQSDFEGVQQWVAGLTGQACARVFTLKGPTRLVIDLVSSSVTGAPNTGGGGGSKPVGPGDQA